MAALLAAALVAGCGGGGGSSGSGSSTGGSAGAAPGTSGQPVANASGSWLTLTPGVVALKSYEGESIRFKVSATSSRTFDKPFNVAVVDSKGVVTRDMTLTKISDLQYAVELSTNAAAAGTYSTDLELRLCEDDPLVCRTPLQGSPWKIPVTLTVATATQAKDRLKFTPAALDLVTYQGESLPFTLSANAVSPFTQPVKVGVVDTNGLLAAPGTMRELPAGQFSTVLNTASTLAAGEHSGSLEVRVCYDDPATCRSPVSGSPWQVPVKLAVKPAGNLTTLSTIASLSPWSTYNGTAGQNPYQPASFDPAAFTRRWNKQAGTGTVMSAPVVEDGRVFVLHSSTNKWELSATSEATGAELWRYDLGVGAGPNPLATGNGKLFVRTTGMGGSFLWAFDQASGQMLAKTLINPSPELHRAPTVIGDSVYMGNSTGFEKFNAATKQIEWRSAILFASGVWTPAVSGGYAYSLHFNSLFAVDTATGSAPFSFQNPAIADTSGVSKSLVVAGNLAVARVGVNLAAIDLQSRTLAWSAANSIVGQHVVADDTLYSLGENGMVLEARAAVTGVLQWKTGWLFGNSVDLEKARLIATSNLVFISSPTKTQAIDRTTHQVVWTYPFGGEVALSDRGVLYIASPGGNLYAINLR
jgi:hypothetical protein